MVDEKTLRRAQLKMVEILTAIDDICTRHNIDYWLTAGTLLGAVRHNGFIPWDDDCDIIMFRKDYDRFMEIAQKELPKNLLLQNKDLNPNYPKKMTKVHMKGTKLVEAKESMNEKFHQGIWVDVFILDYYPDYAKYITRALQIVPKLHSKKKKSPKGSLKYLGYGALSGALYLLHGPLRYFFYWVSKFYQRNENLKLIGLQAEVFDDVFMTMEDLYPINRNIIFEGKFFPIQNQYRKWLEEKYGDYMTIPPVEERRIHAKYIEC